MSHYKKVSVSTDWMIDVLLFGIKVRKRVLNWSLAHPKWSIAGMGITRVPSNGYCHLYPFGKHRPMESPQLWTFELWKWNSNEFCGKFAFPSTAGRTVDWLIFWLKSFEFIEKIALNCSRFLCRLIHVSANRLSWGANLRQVERR